MISTLPPNWTFADFNAWYAPISLSANELKNEYVLARTPQDLLVNTNEWLLTGSTSSPLPLAWTMAEFTAWITGLLVDASAAYYAFILASTPSNLQAAVKERINYQQPPPTNDLINGGNSGLPGTPGVPGTLPPGSTLTRASGGTYWKLVSSVPTLTQAAVNEARFTVNATTGVAEGMRNEPAATNSLTNSVLAGSVPGSPGTVPTGTVATGALSGLVQTIVGSGVEDGIAYVDVQYTGTPASTSLYGLQMSTTPVAIGQTWAINEYMRLVGGSITTGTTITWGPQERTGGSVGPSDITGVVPTGDPLRTQRITKIRTLTGATTDTLRHTLFLINYTAGTPLNLTLRIGLPQLVQASVTTSVILTSGAPATRAVDIFNIAVANGTFDMVVTRNPVVTTYPAQVITTGKWLVPTDPSPVKTVVANVVAAATPTYGFMAGDLPAGATLNRPTAGWYFGAANQIRNSSASGAVVGSPGTLPTNWVLTDTTGLVRSVVGTGVEDGIPYVDISWSGTSGAFTSISLQGEVNTFVDALNGQTWTGSWYVRLMAGALPDVSSFQHQLNSANASGSSVGTLVFADLVPTAAPLASQRSTLTRTNNNAATAKVKDTLSLLFLQAVPVNMTIRFAVPYLAQGPVALLSAASDVPRFRVDPSTSNLEGLLNEPPAVNSIRNASAIGIVTGSPGTTPTNWSVTGTNNGVTRTVVGGGTEDGVPYVDIRYAGTPSANGSVSVTLEGTTAVAALAGQTWVASTYLKLAAGTLGNLDTTSPTQPFTLGVNTRDSGGSPVGSVVVANIGATGAALRTQRNDMVVTLTATGTAFLTPRIAFSYLLGAPIDLTLRIGLPQLVQSPAPTSAIVTTNAAVTRGSDLLVCPIPNPMPGFWDITVKRASGTTVVSGVDLTSGVGTSYAVPTDPSPVQSVKFALSA